MGLLGVAKTMPSCEVEAKTSVKRLRLATQFTLLLCISLSCRGPISQNFAKLEISSDLHLVPSQPLSTEPSAGSFYFVFHAATGLTDVDHLWQDPAAKSPTLLLFLETNHDQVLDRTTKSFQLLRGSFGTVYADKTCFFNRPPESNWSYVSVHSYFNTPTTEVPSELPGPPGKLPPLTSLSLVRVFRAFPEYLVVAANYEANGDLGSLHIDGAKDGNWLHSNFVPAAKDGFVQRIPKDFAPDALKKYGIPTHIDVRYFLSRHFPLPSASLPQEMVVFNQHYGFNKIIRQDQLKDGTVISSRFLQPSETAEENALNPECESRFHQQQTLGLPTVE